MRDKGKKQMQIEYWVQLGQQIKAQQRSVAMAKERATAQKKISWYE